MPGTEEVLPIRKVCLPCAWYRKGFPYPQGSQSEHFKLGLITGAVIQQKSWHPGEILWCPSPKRCTTGDSKCNVLYNQGKGYYITE